VHVIEKGNMNDVFKFYMDYDEEQGKSHEDF
jgi:hypothetical protein